MTIPVETISAIKREVHNRKGSGGTPLYIVVSGAHLYGFESPDSDVDLRGCYITDTNHILGLYTPPDTINIQNGTIDCELFEVKKELALALKMNCNVIEHLIGAETIYQTDLGIDLKEMVHGMLSKNGLYNSYKGLATFNYKKFVLSGKRKTVKKYLYVLRGLLAGIYALENGLIEPNIERLARDNMPVLELIYQKKHGSENMDIKGEIEVVEKILQGLFSQIDESYKLSPLQDMPSREDREGADEWLRRARRQYLADTISNEKS